MSRIPLPRCVALLALLGALAACSKTPLVTLEIVTPAGEDTFAGATRLRVRNLSPALEQETALTSGAAVTLDLKEVTAGGTGTAITIDALDDAGSVLARGSSPPFNLLPTATYLRVYVARVGAVGEAPTALPAGRRDLGVATMTGIGAVLAGGAGADGAPTAATHLYNEYLHQIVVGADLGVARTGLAVFEASDSVVAAFGGRTASGTSSLLEVFDPWQGYSGAWVAYSTEGDPSLARAFAPVAAVTDGFLCVGGTDAADAPLATAALLAVGTNPTAAPLAAALAAPRAGHTVTRQLDGAAALVYGGGDAGAPVAERYSSVTQTFTAADLDPALRRSRHSATLLDDGRVAVVGGVDPDGAARGDVIVVAADGTATVYTGVLQTPRARHTATLVGGAILVAGGEDDAGTLADAEVVDVATVAVTGAVPLRGARAGHAAVTLASGTVLLAGGEDADGVPLARLELYTPAP